MPHPLPQLFAQLSYVASHLSTLGPPPQHLTLVISNFQLKNTTVTLLTPFFFFLLKRKSFSFKTNCSGWSTVVRKWENHPGRHHPMPENKNPTLRNITSPPKDQNPLLLESAKDIVRLRFALQEYWHGGS